MTETPLATAFVQERDRYGRLLAYVWRVGDGLFVNEAMVRDGYASVYTVPPTTTGGPSRLRIHVRVGGG